MDRRLTTRAPCLLNVPVPVPGLSPEMPLLRQEGPGSLGYDRDRKRAQVRGEREAAEACERLREVTGHVPGGDAEQDMLDILRAA